MKMKNFAATFLAGLILTCSFFAAAAEKAVVVHNTLDEVNGCTNKLKLKLVRVWGGDDEEDENKFFKAPIYVAIDQKNHVFIADLHRHQIKVFDRTGKYLRSLGQKGLGPGDTYAPCKILFSPESDLVVYEGGSLRFQYFNPTGKSKKILKLRNVVSWFGLTANNQLIVYRKKVTYKSRTLVSILDEKGKSIKDIGTYHDNATNYRDSASLKVALAGNDNIIVANSYEPVIRKYNLNGEMTAVFNYDTPFNLPVEVNLNERGDEIEINRTGNVEPAKLKKVGSKHGIAFQRISSRGILGPICKGIAVDSENRIYLLALKREVSLEEIKKMPGSMGNSDFSKIIRGKNNLDMEIDFLKILVFSPQGKVIAEAPVTKKCDEIIISGNRLFITDAFINKRILEYEMQFENNTTESTQNETRDIE
ncbi:MAG: hypothetical protein GY950_28620 [bacterium]|nr:hypothetical protein [bacterium]